MENINEINKGKNEFQLGDYINWILTIILIGILLYAIYMKFIFVPTCDCSATYEQICNQVTNKFNLTMLK